jgi:transposase-like protein
MDKLALKNFYKRFPSEDVCVSYLAEVRWSNGRVCPHCGGLKSYEFTRKDKKGNTSRLYKCAECKNQFTAKVGTIFTDSHIPLQDWFLAVHLLTSHKKGVSSVYLANELEITQKTAWFMLQRIRYAMSYRTFDKPLDGTIEGDETYIGGKASRKDAFSSKVAVLGLVEKRKDTGRLVTAVTKQADATVALPFVRAHAAQGAEIQTDESRIYSRLKREYPHRFVTHAKHEYVRGDVSTNTIEGAWNHLKLGLKATYMSRVTPKHLEMYCDEFSFRWNARDMNGTERLERWMARVNGKHLPYKSLVG